MLTAADSINDDNSSMKINHALKRCGASNQNELNEWESCALEPLETLHPRVKAAISAPLRTALLLNDEAGLHQTVEEIVEDAVSRCQDLVLDDTGSGSTASSVTIADILNGLSLLAGSLRIESSR